jgi:hypothetical protein
LAKIHVDATRLVGCDVNRVSLVKHGANRIPFRIMKEEGEDMLDLQKVGRTLFHKADSAPGVVAVLVSKTADKEKLLPLLQAAGLNTETEEETEDAIIYKQPNAAEGKTVAVLKLSDDVALAINGLSENPVRTMKDFETYNLDSTTFTEVMNTNGFFPAVFMTMEAVCKCVSNIMDDADGPNSAKEAIIKAFDDAKNYIAGILDGVPVQAFKADTAVRKYNEVITIQTPQTPSSRPSGVSGGKQPNSLVANPNSVEASHVMETRGEETGQTMEGRQGGDRPRNVSGGKLTEAHNNAGDLNAPSPIQANQATLVNTIVKEMKGLIEESNAGLSTFRDDMLAQFEDVKKSVGKVKEEVAAVDARVKKAEEAVTGTAIGEAGDEKPARIRSQKGDGNPPPLLDTAFNRRSAA